MEPASNGTGNIYEDVYNTPDHTHTKDPVSIEVMIGDLPVVITSKNVKNVKNFIGTIDETLAKVKQELDDPEIMRNIIKLEGIINQLHLDYLTKIQGRPRGEQPKPQAQPPKPPNPATN